jgi:hypothetical protein
MQVLGDSVFKYVERQDEKTRMPINQGIIVSYGDEEDRVLTGITEKTKELGPTLKWNDGKLWRTYEYSVDDPENPKKFINKHNVEVIDLETFTILSTGALPCKLDYYAQTSEKILLGVGSTDFMIKDYNENDKIHTDVIKKESGVTFILSVPVSDSEFVASLCKHNHVHKLAWLLRRENRSVARIKEIEMKTLPCNHFDLISDFQLKRSDKHVLVAITGYKRSLNNDPKSAFIAVMLYELGKGPYPTLIANLKCVPPVEKRGAPKADYAICPKKDAPGVFTIAATWSDVKHETTHKVVWSDKNLVEWTIDANSAFPSIQSVKEVIGVHKKVNSSEGLYYDQTASVKASSVDPYSYSGFFKSPGGAEEVFSLRNITTLETKVVKTWDDAPKPPPVEAKEIYRLMDNMRLTEDRADLDEDEEDDSDTHVKSILPMFNAAYKYWIGSS